MYFVIMTTSGCRRLTFKNALENWGFYYEKNGSRSGQGFESHTFQVNFDPLKLFKLLITDRRIYIHLKLYSGHKKSKKVDLFSEGLPVTVQWYQSPVHLV